MDGQWEQSQQHITNCLEINNDYGPLLAISEFMDKTRNIVPEEWKGYRNIDQADPPPAMNFIREGYEEEVNDDGDLMENESLS